MAQSAAKGSCDLLLTLSTRDPVAQLLGEASIGPGQLLEVRDDLEAMLGPEPADWRVRLADRGGGHGDLEQLLAICRSADSHAYQLLEQLGVCCATLRRVIIERLRAQTTETLRTGVGTVPRPPAARMSRSRRGNTTTRPATGRPVRTARAKLPPSQPSLRRATALLEGDPPDASERPDESPPSREDDMEAGAPAPARRRLRDTANPDPRSLRDDAEPHPRRRPDDPNTAPPRSLRDDADPSPRRRSHDPDPRSLRDDAEPHPRRRPREDREPRSPRASMRAERGWGDPVPVRLGREVEVDAVQPRRAVNRRRVPRTEEQAVPQAPAEPRPPTDVLRTARVHPNALPPLHGRDRELAQLADALGRRRARVPLLVGPVGCGRTLLAKYIATQTPDPVYLLEATAYDDEEGLAEDLAAIDRERGIVIFDELDRVPSEAAPHFLGALSHAWTTGQPRVLTVVSPEGHGRLGNWLPGVLEGADAIRVDPLHGAALCAAVESGAGAILRAHGLGLAPDAKLGELTRWADRYLTGLAMPGRALDLLDLSCARTVRNGGPEVSRRTWLDIVSERSGLSAARVEAGGDQELLDLEHRLARSVVGHEAVTTAISRLVRRNRAGFGGHRPVLTALLLGPSGVGKTELAKALAASLFDRDDALLRLDMSEYAEPHAVARIVGAPPGYIGHEQGGALTDPLLRRPHCVVLLDEIEKAHRDVHQLLLQVFDDGRLTDGRGRTVDFRHAAIIMTSNLGADRIHRGRHGPEMDEHEVQATARKAFPVELWNRIEAPLVMQPLTPKEMAKICRRLAAASSERLFKERGIRYALSDRACHHLVRLAGRDPSLGARPLRHLLVREVESVIADAVLNGELRAGTHAAVDIDRHRIVLR